MIKTCLVALTVAVLAHASPSRANVLNFSCVELGSLKESGTDTYRFRLPFYIYRNGRSFNRLCVGERMFRCNRPATRGNNCSRVRIKRLSAVDRSRFVFIGIFPTNLHDLDVKTTLIDAKGKVIEENVDTYGSQDGNLRDGDLVDSASDCRKRCAETHSSGYWGCTTGLEAGGSCTPPGEWVWVPGT